MLQIGLPKKLKEETGAMKKAGEVLRKAEETNEESKDLKKADEETDAIRKEYERKWLKRRNKGAAEDQTEPKKRRFLSCAICPPPSDLVANPIKFNSEEALHGHMAESHFRDWILKQHPGEESSTVCR